MENIIDTSMNRPVEKNKKKLNSVQILRATAALMVVAYHGALELINFGTIKADFTGSGFFKNGEAGVDLFFVISGFVIFYSLDKSGLNVRNFFISRISRVVPLYWFYTGILVLGAVAAPGAIRTQWDSATYIIKSFLFIPVARATDGLIQPVLALGWTLNYEIFFYVVLGFLGVLVRKVDHLLYAVAIVLLALVLRQLLFPWTNVPMDFWSSGIVLEFVSGACIFFLHKHLQRLHYLAGALFVMFGAMVIFTVPTVSTVAEHRLLRYEFGSASILFGLLEVNRAMSMSIGLLVNIGNWSYSLYLLHMFPLRLGTKIASYLSFGQTASVMTVVAAGLLAVYLAKLSYQFLELPLTNFVKRYLTRTAISN